MPADRTFSDRSCSAGFGAWAVPDRPAVAPGVEVPRALVTVLPGRRGCRAGQPDGMAWRPADRGGSLRGPGPGPGEAEPQATAAACQAPGDGEEGSRSRWGSHRRA